MSAVIIVPCFAPDDAIGNDVLGQYSALREGGYRVSVFSPTVDPRLSGYCIDIRKLKRLLAKEATVAIYHHSLHWALAEELLGAARCKLFLKYHNVTPPAYFEGYSRVHEEATAAGRLQTWKIVESGRIDHYLCDSSFNAAEIRDHGADSERISIHPPFVTLDTLDQLALNTRLAGELADGKINVLFVGRIAPNKRHVDLIETLRHYVAFFGRGIRLRILGGLDPNLESYQLELESLIRRARLSDVVSLEGAVPARDLKTYYQTSHVYLLMSEHEGFCVPILEAQHHRLPIIALDRGAVVETLGEQQLAFDQLDHALFANAINVVANDNATRAYLADQGEKNLDRFDRASLAQSLLQTIRA